MKKLVYVGMVLASAVSAGTVVHTITVNPTLTDWSVTNRVPQFDARLGTLKSVQVTVDGLVNAQVVATNLDVISWVMDLRTTNSVSVSAGGLVAANTKSGLTRATPSAGTVVRSAWTFPLRGQGATNRNLGVFVGTNTLPVITSSTGLTWYAGPASYGLTWSTRASAVATVAYVFDGRSEEKDKDGDKDDDKDGGGK